MPGGWQGIRLGLRRLHGDFACSADLQGVNERVSEILDASQARHPAYKFIDFAADLEETSRRGREMEFPVETDPDRAHFLEVLSRGVGCLDRMQDLKGLTTVLVDEVDQFPGKEILAYCGGGTPLTCAYLTNHPGFDGLVEKVQKRYRDSNRHSDVARIDRLVSYLQEHVKRDPAASN